MVRKGHYFGAGPAPLPTTEVEQAAKEFIDYEGLGIGLGEISHRSPQATKIINDTKDKIRTFLNVPDSHEILFLQGGGTGGFAAAVYAMTSYHLKTRGDANVVGDYFVTGAWSAKARSEADRLGIKANVVATGKVGDKFVRVPEPVEYAGKLTERASFVYYCDNETVHGVEFPAEGPVVPADTLLVADVSSNMFSRPVNLEKYAIWFGGAQKNVGIPGVTLYIVRRDILENQASPAELHKAGLPVSPSFLDLSLVAKNNSALNTVSIFAIELINLVVGSLLKRGNLNVQESEVDAKAAKLYEVIDARPDIYITSVEPKSRSRMNIVFNLPSPEAEAALIKSASDAGITGIKGHRSVGGIRVSNYNAVRPDAVDDLVTVLRKFELAP